MVIVKTVTAQCKTLKPTMSLSNATLVEVCTREKTQLYRKLQRSNMLFSSLRILLT